MFAKAYSPRRSVGSMDVLGIEKARNGSLTAVGSPGPATITPAMTIATIARPITINHRSFRGGGLAVVVVSIARDLQGMFLALLGARSAGGKTILRARRRKPSRPKMKLVPGRPIGPHDASLAAPFGSAPKGRDLSCVETGEQEMRLGYFTMPVHPVHRKWAETLKEDREAIILADQLEFYDAFMGEHLTDACENITNSMMFHAS